MEQLVNKKVELELVGVDGNAFVILGTFQKAARRQGWTKEEIDLVVTEATSGDYDKLLQTIIAHTESPESQESEEDFFDELNDFEEEEDSE